MSCPCGSVVVVKGDMRGKPVFIGTPYEMRYRFTPAFIRNFVWATASYIPVLNGRLQLRTMTIGFNQTGYLRAEVTPRFRNTYVYPLTGRLLSEGSNTLGSIHVSGGSFRFAVQGKASETQVDIVNDSIFPSWLVNAEWEAEYTNRAQRM